VVSQAEIYDYYTIKTHRKASTFSSRVHTLILGALHAVITSLPGKGSEAVASSSSIS
jgi:hypothetical protein